ncbi:MAG TPA: hypothetical protein DDY14_16840 [Chromatiaceae bacterium]|jgi:hypothetical protein|nr:hypothetical protein [Chromatiaceae bacterium]HCS90883.1 hypothetical protein [Chromatiaceae bacterium]
MGREGFCGHVSSIITFAVVEAICQAEAEPAVPVDPLWGIWLARVPSSVEDGRILQASHRAPRELVDATPNAQHRSTRVATVAVWGQSTSLSPGLTE